MSGCAATTYSHRTGDTQIGDAIGEPFRDTGWTRENPPEVLIRAAEAPYTLPSDTECSAILNEISSLDLVLGPDLDAEDLPDESDINVPDMVSGAIADAIGGVIGLPYRAIVRRISGASRRERTLLNAIFAGMVRRAFLKGVARTACAPIAAEDAASPPLEPDAPAPEGPDAGAPTALTRRAWIVVGPLSNAPRRAAIVGRAYALALRQH